MPIKDEKTEVTKNNKMSLATDLVWKFAIIYNFNNCTILECGISHESGFYHHLAGHRCSASFVLNMSSMRSIWLEISFFWGSHVKHRFRVEKKSNQLGFFFFIISETPMVFFRFKRRNVDQLIELSRNFLMTLSLRLLESFKMMDYSVLVGTSPKSR